MYSEYQPKSSGSGNSSVPKKAKYIPLKRIDFKGKDKALLFESKLVSKSLMYSYYGMIGALGYTGYKTIANFYDSNYKRGTLWTVAALVCIKFILSSKLNSSSIVN